MDDADGPAIVIKRKGKGRASNVRTTLPGLATRPASTPASDEAEDSGVVRRKKKSLADRLKEKESLKKVSRLSFGAQEVQGDDESDGSASRTVHRLPTAPDSIAAGPSTSSLSPASTSKHVYSAEYLSQLRAQTISRPRAQQDDDGDLMVTDEAPANIPTQNAIAAARTKRETMRKLGTTANGDGKEDGFISLDLTLAPSRKGESRLVREEDEIGEGDDDMAEFTGAQETVPLGRKATQAAKSRMRADVQELIDDAEGDAVDDEDEEAMEWEAAQVRRAGDQRHQGRYDAVTSVYRPAPIPQATTVPTLSRVQERLKVSLGDLEASHAADDEVLRSLETESSSLDQQEAELREEVVRINKKHEWFAAFFEWIADVAAFLDTKYPRLEHIERDNLAHQKERVAMLRARRFADDSDDVSLFTGAAVQSRVPPPPPLRDGDASPPLLPAPDSAFSDERVQRRLARQDRKADLSDEVLDDESTLDLVQAVASLATSLADLFADVESADFKDPAIGVRKRFADWRNEFPDDYGKAFGTLAMVGVWEFWARVEMALWNPFKILQMPESPQSLDGYMWHRELAHYFHDAPEPQPGVSHDDTEPIAALVESVVIPRFQQLASAAYDVYSPTATSAALHFVEEVTFCVESQNSRFQELMHAFLTRIQEAILQVQALVLPHLADIAAPTHALDADAIAARERFSRRLLLLATQAMRWRRDTRGLLVRGWAIGLEEGIARELVGKVAMPILEAGWTTGGKELAGDFSGLFQSGTSLPADLRNRMMA